MSFMTYFKHVKWKKTIKPPLFNAEELRKFRLKLQTQLSALEKPELEIKVTERVKPIEKVQNENSIGKDQNFINVIVNEKIKEGDIVACIYTGISNDMLIAKRI